MKIYTLFFILFISVVCNAQNYVLDNTFGTSGSVVTNYNMYYDNDQAPTNCFFVNNKYIFVQKTQLSAFNYDGTVDYTFGTNGYSRLINPLGITIRNSKLIGNDIYMCGLLSDNYLTFSGFIAKMDINGVIDTSFGSNGIASFPFGSIQSGTDVGVYDFTFKDGSIYAVGTTHQMASDRIFVTKLFSSGVVDADFDPNGYKTYPIFVHDSGHGIFEYENDLLIVGRAKNMEDTMLQDQFDDTTVFIKIDESGNYVSDFGTNGVKKIVSCNGCIGAFDEIRIPNLVGNDVYLNRNHFQSSQMSYGLVTKININTLQETSMGWIEDDSKAAFLIDGDKVYTLGCDHYSSNCDFNFYIRRRNLDGTLDLSFNQTGNYEFNFPQIGNHASIDYATIAIKHDDDIIMLAGYTNNYYFQTNFAPYKGFAMIRIKPVTLGNSDFIVQDYFSVYPNPIHDKLNIENHKNRVIDNIIISDVFGKTILKKNGKDATVDMTEVNSGLYFLKITSEGKTECIKIMKI